MSDTLHLPAETRERAGKGASRALRRGCRVPAVVYGGNEEPLAVHVEEKLLVRQLGTGHFFNSSPRSSWRQDLADVAQGRCVPPRQRRPLHVDFLRVSKDAKVHVNVPVIFANEEASPGLKRGAALNIVRHELELVCAADKIPDDISIDVTGFEVGDLIHISHVKLPSASKARSPIATSPSPPIVAPSGLRSEEGDNSKTEGAA